MSLLRCDSCARQVDTDKDTECSVAPDEIMCKACREKDVVKVADMSHYRQKRPEQVFECPCGSQHFYLIKQGEIQCRSCDAIRQTIEWSYRKGMMS